MLFQENILNGLQEKMNSQWLTKNILNCGFCAKFKVIIFKEV